jgi:CubicO group peptidase (beta-lactamase class C family)
MFRSVLAAAVLAIFTAAAEATPPVQSAPAGTSDTPALTAADLDTFFSGYLPYALASNGIAGATLSVVKDGRLLFAKGYGYADVQKKLPVIADQTLFRPGSVSKLLTWTAVMQLVETGKIDLDADINTYLDFRIPPAFGKPITMRNILTHTPGFGETTSETFVDKKEQLQPYRDYLVKHMPSRIYPPGKVVAYSNYGAMLAGYIVQRLSGEPFDSYVDRHIFRPLDMQHSTFAQPIPVAWNRNMAQGYIQASDEKPFHFEYIEVAPAGSLTATATDMAHFMIAHLHGGRYGDASILRPETVRLMQSPQSRMAPGVNGFDLGFYQEDSNGLRIIGHAGDTNAFHSDLHLLLDKDVGFFISFNSIGKAGAADILRVAVFQAFLDRYFPWNAPVEPTLAHPQADAARVAGWYGTSRRLADGLRAFSQLSQTQVTALPDGEIQISFPLLANLDGTPKKWREVGPLTYRESGGDTHVKFVADAEGNVSYWIAGGFPPVLVFERVSGLRQLGMVKWLGSASLAVLFLTIVIWFGGWIVRRRFHAPLQLSPLARRLRWASRLGVLALLSTAGAWLAILMLVSSDVWQLDGYLIAAYAVSVVGIVGALAVLAEVVLRITRGPGGWLVRSGELLLGLSALYGIWVIFAFGLVDFSLRY